MPTVKLGPSDRLYLQRLGKKIEKMILEDRGYRSLDAFALEHHELVSKPTLYQICAGKRDMKLSTILGLSHALEVPLAELLS